jgi:hypothetical protein
MTKVTDLITGDVVTIDTSRTAQDSWRCAKCGGDRYHNVPTGNPPRPTVTLPDGRSYHLFCYPDENTRIFADGRQ